MRNIAGAFKNRILIAILLVFSTMVSLSSFSTAVEAAVALEQLPRCGMEEHVHNEECYYGDILNCGKKTHIHGENCYILRLEDNDINGLLSQVGDNENNSLESLLTGVLDEAAAAELSAGDITDDNPLTNDRVVALNRAISDGVIDSDLVLNESLSTTLVPDSSTQSYALLAAAGEYEILPYAVGNSPSTGTRAINFYINLDGKITFVNSGTLTYNNSNQTEKKKEYYSSYLTVDSFTSVLVTRLSTSNLGSTYYLRFNTNGKVSQASDFGTTATHSSSTIYFADSNNPQYAILSSSRNSTTPVNFYTVTLDMSEVGGGIQQQYVEYGVDSTFTLSNDYRWYDANGAEVDSSALKTINATTTLYARPSGNVVTFVTNGGTAVASQTVSLGQKATRPADPRREGYDFAGWYADAELTQAYNFDSVVSGNISLYAKWTPKSGYVFTFTYTNDAGNVTRTERVTNLTYDTQYSLPDPGEGFVWVSGDESFGAGSVVTVKGDRSFTATKKTLNIRYNVNFGTGSTGFYGAQYPASPTLLGTTQTSLTDLVAGGSVTSIRDVSQRMPSAPTTTHGVTFYWQTYFVGWEAEDGFIIEPATRLSWGALEAYDKNGDGIVELTGKWANVSTNNVVNFCIAYTSKLEGTGGDKNNYTPSLYGTYLGGNIDTSYRESAEEGTEAFEADKRIRALYGIKTDGMWMYSFPSDEYIFQELTKHVSRLTVEGEEVDVDELNSNYYAIRWSVMFCDGADGWHLDGRLVKKEGVIHVEKTFAGEDFIEEGKKDFYITASRAGRTETLILGEPGSYSVAGGLTPYSVSEDKLSYIWHIEDVEYNEAWTITEHRGVPDGASVYTEYSIYDSKGIQSAVAQYGVEIGLTGVTYAPDEGQDHILRAEISNLYLSSDSIAIKKEDGSTGQPIGGARFQLWQNIDGTDVQLTFSKNADGRLVFDQNGSITEISTGSTGYSEIMIEDFSYAAGPVRVVEVGAPAGYIPAPVIVLQQRSSGDENDAEIVSVGGEAYETDENGEHMYAEYFSDEKVLIVKNYSQKTTSVSAKKVWNCPTELQTSTVTVELLANGVLASSQVPNINPIAVLERSEGYVHTWDGLPLYINGQPVVWSIRERKVGDEERTSAGSFVNWIDTYNRYEYFDSEGDLQTLVLEVENDTRRTLLYIEKTDPTGLTPLPGAAFRLQQVSMRNNRFELTSDGYDATGYSNENGWILFDNLAAGYYMLTEITPPSGYDGLKQSVYLYIDASGKIKQAAIQDGAVVTLPDGQFEDGLSRPNDFVIRVPNMKLLPLPNTGGTGTAFFTMGGAALTAAAFLLLYLKMRRKEGDADA